ncbi:type II toxin-antitoxin system prevent-host-death family antitoxin [Klenkia sp. LSe6-5]|uniref:Type II toxin-antitoxin system prevent-host-death family antitoxin n=1 Tax=Klenkia sesuvii TaxID=3103137 RepID=A0ABU8DR00_9ACTN
MDAVTVREPRDSGGDVLNRVARGERLVVTRDGVGVAELRPTTRRSPSSAELVARRRALPVVDPVAWRRDVDDLLDPAL